MQNYLWPQLQPSCLPPRPQPKSFRFWRVLVITAIFLVPCSWLLTVQKSQNVSSIMEFSRISEPGLPLTTNLMSSFKVSNQCFLPELEKLIDKSLNVYYSVESWRTRFGRKSIYYWHNSVIKLLLLQLYLFHFFKQGINLGSFIPEANFSFLSISKYNLYIGIGNLIGQKSQKWF